MFKLRKKLSEFGEIEVSDAVAHGGDHEKRKIEEPVGLENLKRFWGVIIAIIALITLRTAYLQIARGAYYLDKAENNRISRTVIKAPRGIIADRNGEELVRNVASFDAVIVPAFLPKEDQEKQTLLNKCLELTGLRNKEGVRVPTLEDLKLNSFEPFLVKENISREEAIAVELARDQCPGFLTEKTAIREYVSSYAFSHVLGYTGKVQEEDLKGDSEYLMTDSVGKVGVEEYWEKELKGVHGFDYVEVDSKGEVLRKLEEKLPEPGNRLILGVDRRLQEKLYGEIERVTSESKEAQKAAAIMMDPRTGAIRALVSFPSYDNNLFAQGISREDYQMLSGNSLNPLLNRAIGGNYAPGSTVKPLLGVAALSEGVVDEGTTFDCPGALQIGEWRFGDWKVHGPDINLEKAIAQSCDVYFYIVGGGYGDRGGLGITRINKYEKLFGLGEETGIDLMGEQEGFIPTPEWKEEKKGERWYIGNTYHASIGQGDLSVTPIQMANVTAAIANGGTLYQPHLVSKVIDEKSGKELENLDSEVIRKNFVKREYVEKIREAMREAVAGGTAWSLNKLGHDICGKTGTAQLGGTENTHSWFVGFAPFNNPEIVIAVLVEEGGESTDTAVPVAKELLKYYFEEIIP